MGEGGSTDDRHSLRTAPVMHLTDYPRQALLHTFIECVFISSAYCMLDSRYSSVVPCEHDLRHVFTNMYNIQK